MPAEIDSVSLDRGDGAGGVDGGIALDENHSGHVTGCQLFVVGARSGSAALSCYEAIILDLRGKLLERRGLKARENQRRANGLKGRPCRQTGAADSLIGNREL